MEKDASIEIRRMANGYVVIPAYDMSGGGVRSNSETFVFVDKGYGSGSKDDQDPKDTLLGWLDAHFT